MSLRDGEPCSHRGCLNHVTHPCEGCGRVAGRAPQAPLILDDKGRGVYVEYDKVMHVGSVLSSRVRPATQEDIDRSAALHAEGKCDHACIVDEACGSYDVRHCYTCGAGLGAI